MEIRLALTADVKDELTRVEVSKTSVRAAELATILRFAGGLHLISGRIAIESELDTPLLARRVRKDLAELYGVRSTAAVIPASGLRRTNHYLVRVLEGGETLARQTGRLGVAAKAREVRGIHRVVIRDGDAIGAMLLQMGAANTVLNWEELRQRREVRATANRLVNFDDANLRRSAQAAVAACARVDRAMEILGDDIPKHLRYAGELRLKFRDSSLDELGHHADPPMTKDAVAGRIRRLLAMADKKAVDLNIPGTDANLPPDLDDV